MKKTLIISLLFIYNITPGWSQSRFKKYFVLCSTSFLSGSLDGMTESISFHYESGFSPRFKKLNDRYWNPQISWKNKYRLGDPAMGPKFPGSTTALCFTTDAYHMLRTTRRTLEGTCLAYYVNNAYKTHKKGEKTGFKAVVRDFLILTTCRCIGFHFTYSFLFKNGQIRQ